MTFVALIELFETLHKGRGKHIAGSNLVVAVYLKHLLEFRVFQANTLASCVEVSGNIIVVECAEKALDRVNHDRVFKGLGRTSYKVIPIESHSVGFVFLANRWAIGKSQVTRLERYPIVMTYNLVTPCKVIALLTEKKRCQEVTKSYMSLFYILKIRADIMHYTAEDLGLELGIILSSCHFFLRLLHRDEAQ